MLLIMILVVLVLVMVLFVVVIIIGGNIGVTGTPVGQVVPSTHSDE